MIWFSICEKKSDNPFYELVKLMQKGKIFPVQAMKAYMRRRGAAPLILNLDSRLR